jgi:hypothetical protein
MQRINMGTHWCTPDRPSTPLSAYDLDYAHPISSDRRDLILYPATRLLDGLPLSALVLSESVTPKVYNPFDLALDHFT